jgi:hypothetical protein
MVYVMAMRIKVQPLSVILLLPISIMMIRLTIEHCFQKRIVMGPMEEHSHNDRRLLKAI